MIVKGAMKDSRWITTLPKQIIYLNRINKNARPNQRQYHMISPKEGFCGTLVCHKTNMQMRPDYDGPSLAVDLLLMHIRGQGYGKAFIHFAENLSRELGCNGYVFLKASSMFTPKKAPHLFYRKCGFTSLNEKTDARMDKCIRKKRDADFRQFPDELMFYPSPSQNQPQNRSGNSIVQLFKKIISLF